VNYEEKHALRQSHFNKKFTCV